MLMNRFIMFVRFRVAKYVNRTPYKNNTIGQQHTHHPVHQVLFIGFICGCCLMIKHSCLILIVLNLRPIEEGCMLTGKIFAGILIGVLVGVVVSSNENANPEAVILNILRFCIF